MQRSVKRNSRTKQLFQPTKHLKGLTDLWAAEAKLSDVIKLMTSVAPSCHYKQSAAAQKEIVRSGAGTETGREKKLKKKRKKSMKTASIQPEGGEMKNLITFENVGGGRQKDEKARTKN